MKALVVDDSRTMRMAVAALLRLLDFEIVEAADGQEALTRAAQDPAGLSLVMLDWNMPVMDGYEFLQEFRRRPEHAHTRVVMLTTENQFDNIRRALEAGADEYVMKPFTDEMLLEKVKMVVPGA